MSRKLHITFDNFTLFQDHCKSWMTMDEYDALPVLSDQHEGLWQNYIAAKSAHQAACLAIQHALQYPEGSAQAEVARQKQVFEKLWIMYCNMTNNFAREHGTADQAVELYAETLADMVKVLESERERTGE